MAFRRDKQKSLKWRQWLSKHRDELVACGIPHDVFEHQHHWGYFLDHGYFKPDGSAEPIIHIDQMDATQALRLRAFLEQDPSCSDSHALNCLRHHDCE